MDLDFDDQPAAPAGIARAGAKFIPKGRPQPKKKQLSLSTSQPTTLSTLLPSEMLSATQSQDPVSLDDVSTIVPDSGLIDQSTVGTISKENVFSEGLSVLRPCSNVNSERKKCDNGTEAAPANPPDDPKSLDSATFGDFVTQSMQTGEEECHWNMETLNIIQEEGITAAYEQHSGKIQPKPRLQDAVIEEPESHYSVDYPTAANQSKVMVTVTNTVPGGEEHEDHVIGEEGNGLGTTVEEEATRSVLLGSSSFLLVNIQKKEAKGAPVVPPTQESNTNASEDNHYYSQGFDAEDEFGMVETENQENNVVKPDSPVNYQTYMKKTPRTRWSKQDTELFYERIQEFGGNLSMKLLQQEAAAEREAGDGEEAETTTDVPENEEPAKSEETGDGVAGVKEQDGGDIENNGRDECEDNEGDDDDEFWNSYKSDM
ncbi:hypothetical protein YC2023_088379 [Brassica napus]